MDVNPPNLKHHRDKTKWNYFYEFLMLFLAVFCGLLAEYELESILDSKNEKEFILSLESDLRQDIRGLEKDIPFWESITASCDSLRSELKKPDPERNYNSIYTHATAIRKYNNFKYFDRTIEQLKKDGNFRLITKKDISESLIMYDAMINSELRDIEDMCNRVYQELNFSQNKILNSAFTGMMAKKEFIRLDSSLRAGPSVFRFRPGTEDIQFSYYNDLDFYRHLIEYRLDYNQKLKLKAEEIITLINKQK